MKRLLLVAALSLGLVAGCSNLPLKECKGTVIQVDQRNNMIKVVYKYGDAFYTAYYNFSYNDRTVVNSLHDGDKIKVYGDDYHIEGVLK